MTTLSYLEEVKVTGEPEFIGGLWMAPVTVTHPTGTEEVPAITNWYLVTEPCYPAGAVIFLPAKIGGLTATFAHQMANHPIKDRPVRSGNPCLTHEGSALKLLGGTLEPQTAYHRLHWHSDRLNEWIEHARNGTLRQPGEFFEHPDTDASKFLTLAYDEHSSDLPRWIDLIGQHGQLELRGLRGKQATAYPTVFRQNSKVIKEISWGNRLQEAKIKITGLWYIIPSVPIIPPWGYPKTWGQLRVALTAQGMGLNEVLQQHVEGFRDGKPHILLLGYPIPNYIGGDAARVHWQGILLPTLTERRSAPGFRPSAQGRWFYDLRNVLADKQPLIIYNSENHNQSELGSRGLRPAEQRPLKAVIIGAGALGAPLAEHLVRTGMEHITIVDDDVIKHGNLVRHTALQMDVGLNKAESLVARLNSISPHVRANSVTQGFPDESIIPALKEADLIIETTGSDSVITHLSSLKLMQRPTFISVSLGWEAKSLYVSANRNTRFDKDYFFERVVPQIDKDRPENYLASAPREGIGCWHPVFPATYTDVHLMASCAAAFIQEVLSSEQPNDFRIYEQFTVDDQWAGVRRRV